MKKDKNKKDKGKKKDQKPKEEFSGFTFAMGEFDLIFEINFKDEDLLNPNSSSADDKYLDIEKMTSIKDLSFLKDKKDDFLNTIKIKPNNEFIRQIILGNIISKKKCFIDLICFDRPKFEGEEEFFAKIFDYVTIKNKIQINNTPLQEGSRWSFIVELKHKNKYQKIISGKTPGEEKEEKQKEEAAKKEEEEEKEKQQKEEEEKEFKEKVKEKMKEYKEKREEEKRRKEEEEKNKGNEGENKQEKNEINDNEEKKDNEKNEKNENEENNEGENADEEEEKEEEEEDYEENEAMKEKKIPKFRRQKSVLCNLSPSCTKYNLIYLNHEDIAKIPGDFKIRDLLELLVFFKKKKSNIFINFYKNEPSKEEKEKQEAKKAEEAKKEEDKQKEIAQKEEKMALVRKASFNILDSVRNGHLDRAKDIIENKKKEIKEMDEQAKKEELEKIKQELEKIEEEEQIMKDEIRAEEELKKELKKKKEKEQEKEKEKQKKKNEKEMKILNEIFYLTDGYFFDTRQACEIFNNHYLCFTTDKIKNKKEINKQKVFDYFITAIARGIRDEVEGNKVGLFMDNFNKYCIIYTSKKSANKQELNAQPHPKINTHNIKLVESYQEIIMRNKNEYYSILAGLAAHEISAGNKISLEVVYPTYLICMELIKRKVEIEKNEITTINEDEIYKIKINEKTLKQEIEKLLSGDKEGGFVLDCTNKSKSKLKDYVALYDYHLSSFFSSDLVRKDLKNKGFINSKGFIMYDPVYRDVMGAECKNKKKYEGDELKSKIISSIKGLDVPSRLKDKEVDAKKAIEKFMVPTDKKIPYDKEFNQYKQNLKKKKKKKKTSGENNSSDGNSSLDEGKSGSDSSGNK